MAASERGWSVPGFTPKRVLIVAAVCIIGYFGALVVTNTLTSLRLEREETALRQEIALLERRQARLEAVRGYLQTDAFIESVARENGLARPGEIAVVPVGPDGGAPAVTLPPGAPWWWKYLHESERR